MSRPALFSYEGALRVLGRYDRPWLDKADTFLGVSILTAGAVEPDIFSLVDPKNEATASLRKILDGITDRLTGLSGKHRHELIAAAHTIIAVTSVFDAYREEIGADFDQLEITDREKFLVFDVEPPDGKKEGFALPRLAALAVPTPNATRGFQENLDTELDHFFGSAIDLTSRFIFGLSNVPPRIGSTEFFQAVRARCRDAYTHHFLGLAAALPEFQIWAMLSEHAATRAAITKDLAAIRTESLELFSTLLARLSTGPAKPNRPHLTRLKAAAAAILAKPLLRSGTDATKTDAAFPTIENGFVAPSYRLAVYDENDTLPSSEHWWQESTRVRNDLDTFLAAHLAGQESTERPLLVLGNPGAGKSLLMEVLAARLPDDQFAVVTVQLRKVRPQDRVQDQVETALREILSKRVDWGDLADECGNAITPVILLDGFDELIQASGVHQSTYLQQVQEFQERQADRGQPVAVVVTSRVLVADRARIPADVPIVMLEEFDDERIDRWLLAWNTANGTTPRFQPLTRDALGEHVELARQPLLLLMLVLYAADPATPPLDHQSLSNAELYRNLVDLFVLRQVRDKSAVEPAPEIVKAEKDRGWWKLGVAAFAMFNRGHQYVTAAELNRDLAIFAPSKPAPTTSFDTPIDDADRAVENFFFIYSPTLNDRTRPDRRTYEFLHATFGEFLIAEMTTKLLCQMAATRALPVANPYEQAPLDDSKLYALASHQVFAKRKPIIDFAEGLFTALPEPVRAGVRDVLDDLIRSFHDRAHSDPQPTYRPTDATVVSRIATYSANLVCLRALLDKEVPLDTWFSDDEPLDAWRRTVYLWKSGLDSEGWDFLLGSIMLAEAGSWHILRPPVDLPFGPTEARLLGDAVLEGMTQSGYRFVSDDVTLDPQEQLLLGDFTGWQVNVSGSGATGRMFPYDLKFLDRVLRRLEDGARMNHSARAVLATALSREAPRLPSHVVGRALLQLAPRTPEECEDTSVTTYELVSMICAHPDLIASGVFPTELLRHMFENNEHSAVCSLIMVWATLNSADSRVDGPFREFAERLQDAAAPYVDRLTATYLPVDAFEYFAEPRPVEPSINHHLLEVLIEIVDVSAAQVSPQTVLKLVGRFQNQAPEESIAIFTTKYLNGRTAEGSPEDQEALAELREIAG